MDFHSGPCTASADGLHHWKFGKCKYCQKPEGKLAAGSGVATYPGGAGGCGQGGKCMFKFAKCTKCGRGERGLAVEQDAIPPLERSSQRKRTSDTFLTPQHSAARKRTYTAGGNSAIEHNSSACSELHEPETLATQRHSSELKVTKEAPMRPEQETVVTRRARRRSTSKYAPNSAMESQSGRCDKSPSGLHHWKFGKCNYCQTAEGQSTILSATQGRLSERRITSGVEVAPERTTDRMLASDDLDKMECPACGYSFDIQSSNEITFCLKCESVLKARAECHEERDELHLPSPRVLQAVSSTRESEVAGCNNSPDGRHQWDFGKCRYCQKPEMQGCIVLPTLLTKGACAQGGRCAFKFAKCTKCGKQEYHDAMARRPSRNSTKLQHAVQFDRRVHEILERFAEYDDGTVSKNDMKEIVLMVINSSDFDQDDVDTLMEEAIKKGDSVNDVLKSLRIKHNGSDSTETFGKTESNRFGKTDSSKFGKTESIKFGKVNSNQSGDFARVESSKFGKAESIRFEKVDSSKSGPHAVRELLQVAGPDQFF